MATFDHFGALPECLSVESCTSVATVDAFHISESEISIEVLHVIATRTHIREMPTKRLCAPV